MGPESRGQTLVAGLCVSGCFAILVIYALTGHDPPPGTLTLIVSVMSGVVGWYFGARGAISAAATTHAGMITALKSAGETTAAAVEAAAEGTTDGTHTTHQ